MAKEIELMLGISRQRVQVLINRPDFPKPVDEVSAGKIYRRRDVEKWAKQRGRTIN
jgi:prophage regulatory protein